MSLSRSLYPDANPIHVYEQSVDLASVAADAAAEQAVTVTGVAASDLCIAVIPPTGLSVGIGGFFVSAADEVTLLLINPTASPVDEGALTFKFVVAKG